MTPILFADSIKKNFGIQEVVRGVSLSLTPGEVVGLLGPNGAGKTTIVSILYGSTIPDEGTVTIGGFDVFRNGRSARELLGVVPQDDRLDPDFSVFENLLVYGQYYKLASKEVRSRAEDLLKKVDLFEARAKKVDELSGGMKRRLVLARALINRPRVIFLDEPTTGLDPYARQQFWSLVSDLKKEGISVLLTTHYMDEAERLCDRILLLDKGTVLDEGTPAVLIANQVGDEVVEVDGVAQSILESFSVKILPYGGAFVLIPREIAMEGLCEELTKLKPTTLKRRKANLEDVFLQATGATLL